MLPVPRVKICGLTNVEDVRLALAAGADGFGFLVGLDYAARDEVTPQHAANLVRNLPPLTAAFLVTHRTALDDIVALARIVRPQVVQIHGDFALDKTPALREALPGVKLVKAVHVVGERSIDRAREAAACMDAVLLDTRDGTRIGGTGRTHDWHLSRRIRDAITPFPLILAGGLTPENVERAIRVVEPFAVDVNTGVAIEPGRKSPERLLAFVAAARRSMGPWNPAIDEPGPDGRP